MTGLSSHRNLIILWMKILVDGLAILVLQITSMRCQMSLLHKGAPRFEKQHGINFFSPRSGPSLLPKTGTSGKFEKNIRYILYLPSRRVHCTACLLHSSSIWYAIPIVHVFADRSRGSSFSVRIQSLNIPNETCVRRPKSSLMSINRTNININISMKFSAISRVLRDWP